MLERNTPMWLRLGCYALWDAAGIVRRVVHDPLRRESWGRLLNLPRFGVIEPQRIYRGAQPISAADFDHLERLGVRTLLCVRGGGPRALTRELAERRRVRVVAYDIGNDYAYDAQVILRVVALAVNPSLQPVLIHCDGGRHRAGMVAAMLRHQQGWPLPDIIEEYVRFASPSPFPDNIVCITRMIESSCDSAWPLAAPAAA